MPATPEPNAPDAGPGLPYSLVNCLPLLWTRVLFPGKSTAPTRLRLSALFLLIVLPGLLLYPCLAFPLFEPDEGRYAEIPREMLARGDWVVPYLQAEPYLDKPPLLYWLVMLSYRAFGVHDWAARLVPALAMHGCVLLTYLFGRRILGERPAFWGALALGLAPGFLSMGRLLLIDGLLTFCVALSLFAAFEAIRGAQVRWGWWLLASIACGLGVLAKGPVAVLLLVPPLWLHRRLTGQAASLGWRGWSGFTAVVVAIVSPWTVALSLRIPEFARIFLWEHNVVRFLMPLEHLRPIWFYLPVLLLGLLPASLLLVPFIRFLLTSDAPTARLRTPELGFLLLSGGWCVLFFTLSGCKLPTYIMPAFPPLALAAGCLLVTPRWQASRFPVVTATVSVALLGMAHYIAVPWYAGFRSPMARADEVERYFNGQDLPVICYPRPCDTVAFYLGRDDLRNLRSKDVEDLREYLRERPRTLVLCTHRHSLQGLRQLLPPELRLVDETHIGMDGLRGLPDWLAKKLTKLAGETALGLCDIAIVEHLPGK